MAEVHFTTNLHRHIACPLGQARGATVPEVLDAMFAINPAARGYVLDDHGALRQHMVVFVDGEQVHDPVRPDGQV